MKAITLPGLVDPHVHLRDPWQLHKEDFFSGTSAALAGGYTTIVDMPNNQEHIISGELLDKKITSAKQKIVCDIGFYFSSLDPENIKEFEEIYDKVCGIKLFITTTTNMANQRALSDLEELVKICSAWPEGKPILFHAEDETVKLGIETCRRTNKKIHFCHISSKLELEPILNAKAKGLPITAGVTPHHLFLDSSYNEKLGGKAYMLPRLKTTDDQKYLWDNLDHIDIIESDHAPHSKDEKESSNPPPGVPGLETTLPLLLTAEAEGKITRNQLLDKLHFAPAKLLDISEDKDTKIEVSMEEYEIKNEDLLTKAGWSPFAGRKVVGKVKKVYIRGNKVFENGKVIANPGSGKIVS